MTKIKTDWLFHAPQQLLAKMFGFPERRLCEWFHYGGLVAERSRQRWCRAGQRYGLSKLESAQLLDRLLQFHQQRRAYQLEIDRMIANSSIVFSRDHFEYAKISQLAKISGVKSSEFCAWFHSFGRLPSHASLLLLMRAFRMEEVELHIALTQRQRRVREQARARDRLADYLISRVEAMSLRQRS